jgi:hypothetical protein
MFSIAGQLGFINELTHLAVVGERISANPPIVTAYNPAVEDRAEDKYGENFYVGQQDSCETRAEAVYQRTAQQQMAFKSSMERWESMTGGSARDVFGAAAGAMQRGDAERRGMVPPNWARDWRGSEMPWSRQYYLDPTRSLVQQQMPRTRTDLVPLSEQTMDIVCGVLNVPRGLLASDSAVKAGVEAVSEAMHRTLNRWADLLSNLMTVVYDHTFGVKDIRDELRVLAASRRRSPLDVPHALLNEADLFAVEERTRVRLAFDLPPSTSPEQLDALYNRGLLSWETYAASQLRLNGFPRDQLASPSDPLSSEDRRELLMGPRKPDPAKRPSSGGDKKKKKAKKEK